MLRHENLPSALDEICSIAVQSVPGAEGASLTSFSEAGPHAAAASDEWARTLDETQFVEREGPCLDAARSGFVFRVRDATAEARWPSYMPRAAKLGLRSMLSVPLTSEAKLIGALNLYSRQTDRFESEDVSLAEVIAGHASLAGQVAAALFQHKALADQLREAMASRATIEQAKGIIMVTRQCNPDDAFKTLVEQSQHENRKLRDVATDIVRRYTA
ncbi:MAG TPA: GAF and ANTAR domain-containing protein [Acidimicrobiales bacterium]|nr:GAF and ANTAR domain-containing protein [Acidimicrobiales bacterium]